MEFLGLTAEQWLQVAGSAGLLAGAGLLVGWLLNYLLGRLLKDRLQAAGQRSGRDLLRPLRGPLNLAVVLIAAHAAVARLDFLYSPGVSNVFFVLYVLAAVLFAGRLSNSLLSWYAAEVAPHTETQLDEQLIPFARRVALILLVIIGLIVLLGRFDVDVSGLVATLGIGSLAIALAAQASLADAISGFVIMVDRPFRIGDRIEILDLDTWGDVVDIGLRSSRIRTRDNRMVIVPNSLMGKSLIVNHSFPDTQYRIQIELGLAYGTDLELARRTLIEAVRSVAGVLPDKPVEALFLQFGESALIFRVRWWLESYVDTRRMFDAVNTSIYQALDQAGIQTPYPTRELRHSFDEAGVRQLAAALRAGD